MQNFKSLGLSQKLLSNLTQMGFETPTPIQEKTIPFLLHNNRDLLAMAQTGTGKTAAFGLPLIELCEVYESATQALVLAPTRELCVQIMNDLTKYAQNVKPLNIVAVYGGANILHQIKQIKQGAHIIVATPGRMMDLMKRKVIDISALRYAILDESDEMLNMGFEEDIQTILSATPDDKNIWLFSATMPTAIKRIAEKYMYNPVELSVSGQQITNQNIAHCYATIHEKDRYPALKRFIDQQTAIFGIIFCRTKIDTQTIAEKLINDGYNADALHGDLTQVQRDRVMKNFRSRTLQFLVATDVAARGIDVENITHVFHYVLPDELEFYTHRSGRTARAGKTGISLALLSPREQYKVKQLEKTLQIKFQALRIPTAQEICENKMLHLVHRLHEVDMQETGLENLLPDLYDEFSDLSKEEIIKRFAYLEFNHLLDYYRDATDLNIPEKPAATKSGSTGKKDYPTDRYEGLPYGDNFSYAQGKLLFINLGKADGLDKGRLLAILCDRCRLKKANIGKITLKGVYSFFEVETSAAKQVFNYLDGFEFRGRTIRIEYQDTGDSTGGNSRRSSSGSSKKSKTKRR
ncbi:MAG: DEAD/DEAH box helicase [Sphingobacteriales bacterium]|jgi:ATP-dependent RNA helicase DeaD|nr:DEAD/DEAH box helicase [Sphingobacteriales bacterium]MBP9142213.1 DEAD/DEAH box helicase [Chitinophagales bacterium]MDA0199060.1 DEAD/DEAH box helicase [Bacteroidota bacterium]MBK6889668.1 DEAD/DEAH box helicase [Sphingobacteriales bacterium]MBK7527819.1 DEAD/DEAH box helicase [Sphingobacteriales bacterium]